jgi:predicted N-acetyltransferase YhbS
MNTQVDQTFQIRIAEPADAERITSLINCAFRQAEEFFIESDRIDVAEVRKLLHTGEFLVAHDRDQLTGCVYLEPQGERVYLGLLSIEPARQNGGLGSQLMAAAEDRWRERQARFIDINIVNLREELPAFYQKRGYVATGTSPFPIEVHTKLPCHFINMTKAL